MLNCITCGVDLNRCGDVDFENQQCGFCSPRKPITKIIIEDKTYEVKSTIPLQILFSIIGTLVIGLILWQSNYDNLAIWVLLAFITNMILWQIFLGSVMLKPITNSSMEKQA